MRYRALTAGGDYSFGRGVANFLIDSPACVAQSVLTRLALWRGEWFLDVTAGTPWLPNVLGRNTTALYDIAIRQRILDTIGVVSIQDYESNLDRATRALTVTMKLNTQFGVTESFSTDLQVR